MASPIGEVPAAFDLGYDNNALAPPNSVFYPQPPLPLFAGTYSTGSVNTASTDTTGAQTISTFARLTTAQMYVNPMYLDRDIWFREVEIGVSGNTVAGTGSVTGGWMVGLYSQTTTYNTASSGNTDLSSGSCFTKVSDFGYAYRMSQNSVTEASYLLWKGTDYGNSSLTAYATSLSTTGAGSALFTGQRDLPMYSNTVPQTLQAGNYLVLHGFTKTSGGANVFSTPHGMFVSNSLTAAAGTYMGSTAWEAPEFLGSMTTQVSSTHSTGTAAVAQGVNFLPNSFVASQIPTQTGSADVKWLVPNFYY